MAISILIASYLLPWVVNHQPLTMGAYDLAEWTSLLPGNEPLFISLLLRIQLVLVLGLALGFYGNQRSVTRRSLLFALVIGLLIAQLPPLEFFQNMNDPNQIQQFMLVVLSTALIGLFWFIRHSQQLVKYWLLLAPVFAIISSLIAFMLFARIFMQFGLDPTAGYGLWMYVITWGFVLWSLLKKQIEAG